MMDETVGRETMKAMLKLQISLLESYRVLLDHEEWQSVRTHFNTALKAAALAVVPLIEVRRDVVQHITEAHKEMVDQSRDLLQKLLEEEEERVALRQKLLREQAAYRQRVQREQEERERRS